MSNKPINVTGKRIEKLRKMRSLTQEQLAKELSVQRVMISYYENGSRTPKADELVIMAKLFGVTSDYLLGLSDNETTDYQDIGNRTGLSDKSILLLETLAKEKKIKLSLDRPRNYYFIDIINKIVEYLDYFPDFKRSLEEAANLKSEESGAALDFDDFFEGDRASNSLLSYLDGFGGIIYGSRYRSYLANSAIESLSFLINGMLREMSPAWYERGVKVSFLDKNRRIGLSMLEETQHELSYLIKEGAVNAEEE